MTLVFLIGFMGAGKTTLGQQAADQLGWTFLDLDDLIVQREEMSIPEIFEEKGEAYFREVESSCLKGLSYLRSGQYLIATGGGTPCHLDNMDWMKAHGNSIYLRLTGESLANRLRGEAHLRPLIQDVSPAELPTFINKMLEKRESYYLQADQVLEGEISTASLIEALTLPHF